MTRELLDKWVAALRSGQYEQAREYLYVAGRFCCLGVLCDVAGVPWTPGAEDTRLYDFGDEEVSCEIIRGSLRAAVAGGRPAGEDNANALAVMNDDENASFAQIADWIEQHIPVED